MSDVAIDLMNELGISDEELAELMTNSANSIEEFNMDLVVDAGYEENAHWDDLEADPLLYRYEDF